MDTVGMNIVYIVRKLSRGRNVWTVRGNSLLIVGRLTAYWIAI